MEGKGLPENRKKRVGRIMKGDKLSSRPSKGTMAIVANSGIRIAVKRITRASGDNQRGFLVITADIQAVFRSESVGFRECSGGVHCEINLATN